MFPIKDENPTRRKPILTVALIIVNIAIFFATYLSGQFEQIIDSYGLVPKDMFAGQRLYTIFTSMFLHGGFLHIFGNMLYLWIFGDNIEDIGRGKFLLVYFGSGIIAGLAQALWEPSSPYPMIGASGAISGILGAYIVLYPRARVLTLVGYYGAVMIPAVAFLGFWFVLQVLDVSILTVAGAPSGVAYLAHIGGFIAGALMILPVRRAMNKRRMRYTYRINYRI
jgi:membrane associated rhomboid family serine protease